MNIREMPWFERPGVRLKNHGLERLSDTEVVIGFLWVKMDNWYNTFNQKHYILVNYT
jgi:DNA repair protein RadC